MRMQGIASKIQRLVLALGLLPIPLQPFSFLAHTVSSGRYRGVNVDRWGHSVNEPEGGKTTELVSPAMRQLRPAVDEDNQGTGFRATGEVKAGAVGGSHEVVGDREEHSRGSHLPIQ
jgi:hypothetical protein